MGNKFACFSEGKTLSCSLAALGGTRVIASATVALLALAATQTAQAAWAWKCTGTDTKWSTDSNWNKSASGTAGYYFRNSLENFSTYELTFDSAVSVGNHIVRVDNGTSESTPMVWRALDDSYGFTTTATGTPLGIGTDATYGPGYLKIVGGTYYFPGEIRMGGNFVGGLTLEDVKSFTATGNLNFRQPGSFLRSKNSAISAKVINLSVNGNDASTAVFDGGSLSLSALSVIGYGNDSTGWLIATNLTLNTTAEFVLGGYNNNCLGAKGYVAKAGGDWTFGAVLNIAKQSGSTGVFTNYSGTVSVEDDLYVGRSGGTGTLAIEGGTVTVENTHALHLGYAGGHGWLYLDGGDLVCKGVKNINDGHVVFNGGTLRANAEDADGLLGSGLAVTVGEKGGAIDANGRNVTLNSALGAAGDTGPMTFTGGGTVTANGRLNYAGKTRVVAGTTLSVGADQMADIRSQGGLVVAPVSSADPGPYTVLTLTGGGTLTADDVAACKVALVSSANGYVDIPASEYVLARANNDTELVVTLNTARYAWSAGSAGANWTDADKWNSGAATWADGGVAVFESEGDSATVDAAVSAPRVEFYANATLAGSGTLTTANIFVAAGKTVTISAPIADGQLVKTGEGTLVISGDSKTLTGITIEGGILKYGAQNILAKGITVEVKDGAACDVNGNGNGNVVYYKIAGAGPAGTGAFDTGALRNTGADVSNSQAQMTGIELTADAVIGGQGHLGLINSGHAATTLELNGHTLTVNLQSSKGLWIDNTTAASGGTVYVKSGIPYFNQNESSLPSVDFVIDGASSTYRANAKGTVRNITLVNGGKMDENNASKTVAQNIIAIDSDVPANGNRWVCVADTALVSNDTKNVTIYPPFTAAYGTYPKLVKKGAKNLTLAISHTENRIDGGVEIFDGTVVMSSSRSSGKAPEKAISSRAVPVAVHAGGALDATQCGTATFATTTVSVEGALLLAGPASLSASGAFSLSAGGVVSVAAPSTAAAAIAAPSFSLANGAVVSVPATLAAGRYKIFALSSGTFAADAADGLVADCAYPCAFDVDGDAICLVLDRGYTAVDNTLTSLSVSGTTELYGAGGVKVSSLSLPADSTLVLDPIATPVKVASAPVFGSGAKIALSSGYAAMSLGRVVLMTYTGSAAFDQGLFDSVSIAPGATFALAEETAPDGTSKQLVLTVGDYDGEAKEIVVACVGDSITQGVKNGSQNDYPQYRTSIAARLAANGYKPRFRGVWRKSNLDAAGVQAPDDWAYHSGFGCAAVRTTDKSGGLQDNMPLYLDIAGYPDVITLLIGTNDMGMNGKDAVTTFANWLQLVNDTAAQRPDAKIVGATVLPRPGAAGDKVDAFNALLRAEYAKDGKGELPDNFHLLDLNPLVPNDSPATDTAGNYKSDNLHPNWAGNAVIAKAFYEKIAELCPLAAFAGTGDATVTDEAQTAIGVAGVAATSEGAGLAAYTSGMVHVFTIDKDGAAGATNSFTSAPYTERVASLPLTRKVTKVGYFMELVRKGTSRRRWVWVDMDATGKTLGEVDFPWNKAKMQYVAEKLHVLSNYAGIHDIAAGDDTVRGIVEGTKFNYSAGKESGGPLDAQGVPVNLMPRYGWNDTMGTSGGHGCFQVHRIFSQTGADTGWNDAEVLFAWNCWGSGKANAVDEIGIGTYACHLEDQSNGVKCMDYTTSAFPDGNQGASISSDAYSVRRLEIWVEPDPDATAGVHGRWIGGQGDDRLSVAANWDDGLVPVAGDDLDFTAVASATTIDADISGAPLFASAAMGSGVVTFTGAFSAGAFTNATGATATDLIAVGANSTVTLDGDLTVSGTGQKFVVYTVGAGGAFVVDGKTIADGETTPDVQPTAVAAEGAIVAQGLVQTSGNSDNWSFRLNKSSQEGTNWWVVGENGLTGTKNYWTMASASSSDAKIQALDSDFEIQRILGVRSGTVIVIDTTGYGDGLGHTITIGNGTNSGTNQGGIVREGTVVIAGAGRVLANFDVAQLHSNAGQRVNPYNVTDAATLALAPGSNLGSGTLSVEAGATLEVAQSGTAALGGSLTLADGATLAFSFTDRQTAPTLSASSVTLGAERKVKVALAGARPLSGTHILTAGGGFTGADIAVVGELPRGVSIGVNEDGNIYARVVNGLAILLK